MIAAWMVYCSLCAVGLSGAAVLAERALLGGRGPVRHVWVAAVALSLLVPAVAFRFAPRPAAEDSTSALSHSVVAGQVLETAAPLSTPIAAPSRSLSPDRNWRATLARFDVPLAVAWITVSLAVAFNFFGGIIALAWMRRGWQRRVVLDVPVYVSERTGPAVVGAVSPAIVVPEWVLALEPRQLALMLRHEQEHRRAGDGRLLTAAQLALIAMPWNVALWWQILRLRVAVELDCDARVLRDADARLYAELLLEVARPRRRPSLMGVTAFAERATQLERRIRVMARHRVGTSRAARIVAASIGLAAVTGAWVAPRPPVPARASAPPAVPPLVATPFERIAPASSPPVARNTEEHSDARATSQAIEKPVEDSARRIELSSATRAAIDRDSALGVSAPPPTDTAPAPGGRGGGAQGIPQPVDSFFKRLFEGITLTRDQEVKARDLLARLHQEQIAQDRSAAMSLVGNRLEGVARNPQRDSALRTLLTNDADRATFDARVAQGPGGGRRSGGPGSDSSGVGRRGGGGGGRGDTIDPRFRIGGGAGRRGGRGDSMSVAGDTAAAAARVLVEDVRVTLTALMAEATFHRLFDGISLTADQAASARALITKTQQETQAWRTRPEVLLRMNWATGTVSMRAASASALMELVSNDADRAKLQSRIVSIPR